jgi:glycosyltransferase 2 family protein
MMALTDLVQRYAKPLAALRKWGPGVIGAVLLVASIWVLWREFQHLSWSDLTARMATCGPRHIAWACALSAASFTLMGVVEWMGLRWSGMPLPWRTAMVKSFIVNGITHTLGSSVVIATAARSWAYGKDGLRLAPSAMTSIFNAVSFTLGLVLLVGVGLMAATPEQMEAVRFTLVQGRALAWLCLLVVAAYMVACRVWPDRWRLFNVPAPSMPYALGQVVLGAIDNALSATILWMLAGPEHLPFASFVFAYAMACSIGALSHIPGGLGVFEGTMAALMPDVDRQALAAGFIGFRLVFYIAPLALAVLISIIDGTFRRGATVKPVTDSPNSDTSLG